MAMTDNSTLVILDQPCDLAVNWLIEQAQQAGLSVLRTFDLQLARHAQTSCPCPHHGTGQCDCQLVVLLVYHRNLEPLAIVAHGYEGQTWFSVVDSPQQRADPHLQDALRSLVTPSIQITST